MAFCIGNMLRVSAVLDRLSIMVSTFFFYSQLGYYDVMKVNSRCQNICYQWDMLKDLTENYKLRLQVFTCRY